MSKKTQIASDKSPPPPASDVVQEGLLRILLKLVAGHKKLAVVLFLALFGGAFFESAGLSLLLPLLSNIVNVAESEGGRFIKPFLNLFPKDYQLEAILALLIATFFLKTVLLLSYRGLSTRFAMNLRERWANKLFSSHLHATYAEIISRKHGTMVNNIAVEPLLAARAMNVLLLLLSKLLLALLMLGLLLLTNWKITLVTILFGTGFFFVLRKVTSHYSQVFGSRRLTLDQEISALITEGVGAYKEIKLFGMQRRFLDRLDALTSKFSVLNTRFTVFSELPGYSIEFLIILLLSMALMIFSIMDGDLEAIFPTLSFFVVVTQRMLVYTSNFISLRMRFLSFVPSMVMIHNLVEHDDMTRETRGGKDPGPLQQDIVFQDVHFSYDPQTPVFSGLNLTIRKNAMTALVGASGAGKTTVMDLLVGLFLPQQGAILINDMPLDQVDEERWRARIGYVSQDPLVFNASIRENIMAGNPDASDQDMIQAAKMANIHDVIAAMPQGYETPVGDKGATLSGGQRQRLTIARAIIRDPDLYIFDEATSSLDGESEQLVLQSIEALAKTRTVLVIAHRVTTLSKADVIYELRKGGEVVQRNYEDVLHGQLDLSRQ